MDATTNADSGDERGDRAQSVRHARLYAENSRVAFIAKQLGLKPEMDDTEKQRLFEAAREIVRCVLRTEAAIVALETTITQEGEKL